MMPPVIMLSFKTSLDICIEMILYIYICINLLGNVIHKLGFISTKKLGISTNQGSYKMLLSKSEFCLRVFKYLNSLHLVGFRELLMEEL